MKRILYVVECQFDDGVWDICYFTDYRYASINFYQAHKLKRQIQKYLKEHGSKTWYKRCFRVVKYWSQEK